MDSIHEKKRYQDANFIEEKIDNQKKQKNENFLSLIDEMIDEELDKITIKIPNNITVISTNEEENTKWTYQKVLQLIMDLPAEAVIIRGIKIKDKFINSIFIMNLLKVIAQINGATLIEEKKPIAKDVSKQHEEIKKVASKGDFSLGIIKWLFPGEEKILYFSEIHEKLKVALEYYEKITQIWKSNKK